jgi:hypothetical protein
MVDEISIEAIPMYNLQKMKPQDIPKTEVVKD